MHPYHKRKAGSNWKKRLIFGFSVLMAVILIIPALIVVPKILYTSEQQTAVDKQNKTESESQVTLKAEDSAFSVDVMRTASNKSETVLLEDYVTRVVASEMPADFEIEALKAQALAARTYIVNYLAHAGEDEQVTDTVQHQVYKNDQQLQQIWGNDYNWKMKKIKQAVAETVGEILTYDGEPITPTFFSTSNGYTENSEDFWQNALPYLKSVASPWDEDSPKFLDQKTISINEVEQVLAVSLPKDNIKFPTTRTESNRVKTIDIGGKTFTGREIREKLKLRSTDFKISKKNDYLIFTTKGYGHGVGMSQYGANGMAKEGKSYKEIVNHYYQGISIQTIEDAAPTLMVQK
ncbi:Amidase enhancer precursor [Paraliobacillus sp. PM-2]|uniref:stage II sporulation protein D n=1 Tax=Paraliobacillus sp. PM-2 TaxID=1462524 RepID=UPI00061BB940|nr:stage II sporulation protein D [Paraliobacillus sp. PM-2]CQR46175.1 Amidase enhancer precursor [Paraliobacillus sp. PM-2]